MKLLIALALAAAPSALAMAPYVPDDEGPTAAPTLDPTAAPTKDPTPGPTPQPSLLFGQVGESCDDTCASAGLVCDATTTFAMTTDAGSCQTAISEAGGFTGTGPLCNGGSFAVAVECGAGYQGCFCVQPGGDEYVCTNSQLSLVCGFVHPVAGVRRLCACA